MWNAGLDEAKAGIKIAGRNISDLRYADDHPYGRKLRETKQFLHESDRGEWKSWLKTQHSKNEDHGIQSHYVMANRWGNNGNSDRLYFPGLQNHCRWWLQPWNLKTLAPWRKSYDKPRQHVKEQRHYFVDKGQYCQSYGFSVVMYGCENWTMNKAECQRIDVFKLWCSRRLLRIPFGSKEIKLVNPKGNQPWIFIRRTDSEAEVPILWPPDVKSWLIGNDSSAGKD